MKVLVVGNGSREHAIAWKLSQSPLVSDLAVAPGNAGTAQAARNVPIDSADIQGLRRYAGEHKVDMTVVGPEVPLSLGIVDAFRAEGMAIFGPTRSAARIESSKSFAKELMLRSGVPTAMAKSHTSYDDARHDLESRDLPVVVKADGLAAGKGVTVARTASEAERALTAFMIEGQLGEAGDRVLIEECLEGTELSVFAFVVGEYVSPMIAACDYKRVGDGDTGPNTGGMGSYSPPPFWTGELEAQVRTRIMEPTAAALAAEGCPYTGVLYAGLMLTDDGPMVIEFNCRMGDPETQAILPRLKSDLAEIMAGVVASGGSAPKSSSGWGSIQETAIDWDPSPCVGVVLASGGYPGGYRTGYPIHGLEGLDGGVTAFHAGTKTVEENGSGRGRVVTDGGRVLTVSASGGTLEEARQRAYSNVERIGFEGSFYRRDIAFFV